MPNKTNEHIISSDSASMHIKPIPTMVKDTIHAPSLFQNHLLAVKNPKSQLHITDYDSWVSLILLFVYALFVWIYVSNRKKLSQVIKGFYTNRSTNQLTREEFSIGNRVSAFLSIFFVVTLSIFIVRVIQYYHFHILNDNTALLGVITALIIIIAYTVKFATIKILGYVFQQQKEASDYLMIVFLFCNTLGLFMLPLVICLTFVKQVPQGIFIYTGMVLIAVFIGVRIIRGIILGLNSSGIFKLYLFMYLCALEILPFVILVKLFMNIVK